MLCDVTAKVELRQKLGTIPRSPEEQNRAWYRLYKSVQNEPEVEGAHRLFLLFRDVASLSLLTVVLPIALFALGAAPVPMVIASFALLVQYGLCVLAARINAERLVRNAMAEFTARP